MTQMRRFFFPFIFLTSLSCGIETNPDQDLFLFLVVNEVTDHEVQLSWTISGNEGPVVYNVAVNDSTVVDDYPETQYLVSDLDSSSPYTIEVTATDASGQQSIDSFEVFTLEDTVWEGPYDLDSQEKYDNFNFTRIVGELRIRNLDETDLSNLSSLEAIGGLLIENCQISSLNGLQNIQDFILGSGSVSLIANPNLSDLTAIENLSGHMAQVTLKGNPNLLNLDGLGLAPEAFLRVESSPLPNLETLEFSSTLRGVRLKDLPNFDQLGPLESKFIDEFLEIENLPQLGSINGLGNISALAKRLVLIDLPELTSLVGLQNIQSIGMDLESDPLDRSLIIRNVGIANLEGLNGLEETNRIVITDCPNLLNLNQTSLSGSVPEGLSLIIQRNPSLINFCGFTELANNVEFLQYAVNNNGYNPTLAQLRSEFECAQ